jgi:flagellar basal-body rod protein FlgC
MSLFSAIDIGGTGVNAMQTWIDTSAGNLANEDDSTSPTTGTYADQQAVFSPVYATTADGDGAGVSVAVESTGNAGTLEPDPSNPQANAAGEVRVPDVSQANELVDLMQAQDGYQADTSAISRAVSAYQSALTIGS